MKDIQACSAGEAFTALKSSPAGLTGEQAAQRLVEHGRNEIGAIQHESRWLALLRAFTHFLALILWVAAALALFFESRQPGTGMATLGFAIIGVILVNGAFSFWQEYRAERALVLLQAMLPPKLAVRRGNQVSHRPVSEIVPGDVVLLRAGDIVPAECRVVESCGLRVNNATVTGESVPHWRDAEASTDPNPTTSRNILLAGTSVVAGEAVALVFATRTQTSFGRIASLTQEAREPPSPLQQEVAQLSRWIAVAATTLGLLFFCVGTATGLSFWQNFMFAIGIIVANVPEGLLPTITLSLAMASQRMARRKAIVRKLPSVETLGAATVICTDKTGTLTEGRLTAMEFHLPGRTIVGPHLPLDEATRESVTVISLCHGIATGGTAEIGDPLDLALLQSIHANDRVICGGLASKLGEVPFDSRRKRISTLHKRGRENLLCAKGAPEALLERCTAVVSHGSARPMCDGERELWLNRADAMGRRGLRVLALASKPTTATEATEELEHDLQFVALAGLADPPRPEVPAAIEKCRAAGIKVIMVTGDHALTAAAIGRAVGLVRSDTPRVVEGDELRDLTQKDLQKLLDGEEVIFARIEAEQKLRIVLALQQMGHIVAATGDGVNDAPALKQADIGIAMGRGGTEVARSVADIILLDDNFATIVAAVEEGRAVYANVRKFLTYILTSNIPEIVPYLAFVLFRIPLPLTVIQILAVDLGTDMVPALGLGAERARAEAMKQPPRPRRQRMLDWRLVARAYGFLGLFEAAAAMTAFFAVLQAHGWVYGAALPSTDPLYMEATTACLAAIVVMQVFNLFVCRSDGRPFFADRFWRNKLLLAGVAIEIALIAIIVYTPMGHAVFGTRELSAAAWLVPLPFAAAMIAANKIRKRCAEKRRTQRRSRNPERQAPAVAQSVVGR